MTAALFGLVGVIVGGLLNAAVSAWQARLSEIAAVRVGARLVFLELRAAALALTVMNDAAAPGRHFPTEAWTKYRESLARVLPDDDWEAVVTAYEILERSPGRALAQALEPKGADRVSDAATVREATSRMQKAGQRRARWRSGRNLTHAAL